MAVHDHYGVDPGRRERLGLHEFTDDMRAEYHRRLRLRHRIGDLPLRLAGGARQEADPTSRAGLRTTASIESSAPRKRASTTGVQANARWAHHLRSIADESREPAAFAS